MPERYDPPKRGAGAARSARRRTPRHSLAQRSCASGTVSLRSTLARRVARRSKDWNEGLAEDLQDPAFTREFLAAAVEDGVPLQQALGKVIRATGVKEFAATVDMPNSNVLRAIHPRHNPTQETLDHLLKPFGLRIGLAELERRRGRAA
jgi:DNA-binding phage protein